LHILPTTLLVLIPLNACQTPSSETQDERARIEAQRAQDFADLARARAELEARTELPQRIDFGDAGSVFIDKLELAGQPGHVNLHMHFTWVNTSDQAYPAVDLRLTLRDPERSIEWSETHEMKLPYRYGLTPDSSYTSWFEAKMHALYLTPGWEWELQVRTRELDSD
jgi:hypothetical protein